MQVKAKNMQISAKIHQKLCKIVQKQVVFSAIKHLFRSKNGQIGRLILWKCAAGGCVWKHPGCILSVFMHLYEGLPLSGFFDLSDVFDRFWTVFGLSFCHKRATLGAKMGRFGVILDHFWVDSGSFWRHLGIILASFLHNFGVVLVWLWPDLEAVWGLFRTIFGGILAHFGPFFGHFVVFRWCIGRLTAKVCKNNARESKNNQISASKFTKKIFKIVQNRPFFRL